MSISLAALTRRLQRLASNQREEAVAARLARYAGEPVAYVREHLGCTLTPKQVEILQKLDTAPYRVLARSANTQGKTFVAAAKCSHFFDTVRPSITLATAPTKDSVRDLLFKELRTLRGRTPSGSAGFLPKDTRLEASVDHYVHGYTAANPDAFQGRHAKHLGLLFDEATGVDAAFWARGETMFESSGNHWWLATYNPNDSASPAFAAEESGTWHTVVLSALEHPNVLAGLRGETPPIEGAVRLETVLRRMAAECESVAEPDELGVDFEFPVGSGNYWHPTTPDFEAQILGRWPVCPTAAVFSPHAVDRAIANAMPINPYWQVAIGCDVARFGDDKTCLAVRVGPCLLRIEIYSGWNTTRIAERLRDLARETLHHLKLAPDASTTVPILIDDTGGYGAGVIDQANGHNFIGVCAASASVDPRYPTVRAHLWNNLAAMAAAGALDFSRLPLNERLSVRQELTAARYWIDGRGRRTVEPKAQIKERLRRSPDRADAICLAYYLAA